METSRSNLGLVAAVFKKAIIKCLEKRTAVKCSLNPESYAAVLFLLNDEKMQRRREHLVLLCFFFFLYEGVVYPVIVKYCVATEHGASC